MHYLPIFCPRIRYASAKIIAETGGLTSLLLLGTAYRRVTVNSQKARITIASRYLWFIRRKRVIEFSMVKAITYGHAKMTPQSLISGPYDTKDSFRVGLRLIDETEVHLFSFVGGGLFINNSAWLDWMYLFTEENNNAVDKEWSAKRLVEILESMLGRTVVPPRY